jgi:hypothetical protein
VVASSILHLFKESVEFNLQKILPSISRPVTGSAFTQARYKIKPKFFNDLVKTTVESYRVCEKKLWKGHILLGGDGSTLNLPPSKDIEKKFGVYSTTDMGVKRYLARIFFVYDVLNDIVVGWNLSKMKDQEKILLRNCYDSINHPNAILILDRCFGNFTTVTELTNRQIQFCIRMSTCGCNFAKKAMANEQDDFIADWAPSRDEKETCKKLGLERAAVKVRVTKIKLKTGETELLVSSLLDQQKYSHKDMGELYHLRWGVEEGYKNLKPKMKIEQFGCRKSEGVLQEFYAHIFIMNMVGLAGMAASQQIEEKTSHRKLTYTYNWKNAYRFLREKIMRLLWLEDIEKLLDLLIAQIAGSLIAYKPDRCFARDTRDLSRRARITQFNK